MPSFASFVSSCLRGGLLPVALTLLACTAVHAQEPDPARDALIVETVLRLDSFDLDSKPKTKEAVLRFLQANAGSEQFFQLIERFQIKDAAEALLELAVTRPAETPGVKAAELLTKLQLETSVIALLGGEDTERAAALIQALGTAGGSAVLELLKPLVTDTDRPLALRSAAAQAIGKSQPGQHYLLELAEKQALPEDLNFTVANVLFASPDTAIQEQAAKYLKLPASANATPLPPLPVLLKMEGSAAHGKDLFANKGTCSKCHKVAGEGKDVGPDLSEIGSKLSKEAFLIAILDPSAGVSHNYETYMAITDDGKVLSGILVSQTDDEIVLKDAEAILHTLKADEVEELKKLPTSLMPADLQKLLTAEELADVVEYLMTLKKAS